MQHDGNRPAIRIAMMPADTNGHGTIFGGVILSHIDLAGAIAARPFADDRVVTVAMKEVVFHEPVYVSDIVSYYAEVTRLGSSSITVDINVVAERHQPCGQFVQVTEATVTYVSVNEHGEKTQVRKEGLKPQPLKKPS